MASRGLGGRRLTLDVDDELESRVLGDSQLLDGASSVDVLSGEDNLLFTEAETLPAELGLDIVDVGLGGDLEGASFSCKCFDEDLHFL